MIIIEILPKDLEFAMPGYEFYCDKCHKSFTFRISYKDYGKAAIQCPYCGSTDVSRRIGKIRIGRSESSRLNAWGEWIDPNKTNGIEDDPQAMGDMMRKMSTETGEDLGPEFDEVVDRLESGQNPDEIERGLSDMKIGDSEQDP